MKKISWIWHDPVWSKVIATAILTILGSAAYMFWPWLSESLLPAIPKVLLLGATVALMICVIFLSFVILQQKPSIVENVELEPASDVRRTAFVPDSREVEILQLLFNSSNDLLTSEIQRHVVIATRQEALYHLQGLKDAGWIRGPLKYPSQGKPNGFALKQEGQQHIMENRLALRGDDRVQ